MTPHPTSFWLHASPRGFTAICGDESARMRFSREAWLLSSGEVMAPRRWQREEDYAKKLPVTVVVRVEAA